MPQLLEELEELQGGSGPHTTWIIQIGYLQISIYKTLDLVKSGKRQGEKALQLDFFYKVKN